MATPTQNSVPTSGYFAPFLDDNVASMLGGTKWGAGIGTGATLTYSFPQGTATWLLVYDESDAWYALDDAQMSAARQAMASWAAVANIGFIEVADTPSEVGEIRFAFTDNISSSAAAHAYMPSDSPKAGDVWFNSEDVGDAALPGSYFYSTIIHELGHAIGLDHSFDLAPEYDNLFYTVMSYTASPWSEDGDNYASFYPTTPMYLDIVALQAIYGTDGLATNSGNTTYTYGDDTYFETIFDTGGKDTIVYAGSDTCKIYLTAGSFCVLSQEIEFSTQTSRSTVAIGPGTIIENARGGGRNDRLEGNAVANKLQGAGGQDTIRGGGGDDIVVGGAAADRLKGNAGADRFDFNRVAEIGTSSHDVILDFRIGKDDIDLSSIDADVTTAGNDSYSFKATADSSLNGKAGELCWYQQSGKTFVIGDNDGNTVADFVLELSGSKSLTAGDFIL